MKTLFPKSEFSRHVVTLMTGTTIAQAIPVAISPILTRIYTPHEFGVFALFVSITSVLAAVANGRYELAIMLPADDEDALNIAAVGLVIASCLTAALLVVVFFAGQAIAASLGTPAIAPWLYLAPLTMLFMGFYNVLNYYNTRQKSYGDIAKANMAKALVLATTQVAFGLMKAGAGGLVSGHFVSNIAANTRLLRNTIRGHKLRDVISLRSMRKNLIAYADFPKYSLPAVFANTLSGNVSSMLVSRFYSAAVLGQYALVQRVLAMPASLLGNAIGQVFFQEASKEKRATGTAIKVLEKTFRKLVLFSIPIFTVAFFIVEPMFALVFGEPWREAGAYARILVPIFAIRFVVTPLSCMNQINLDNKIGMYGNWVLLAITVVVIWLAGATGASTKSMLVAMAIGQSIFYCVFLLLIFRRTSQGVA